VSDTCVPYPLSSLPSEVPPLVVPIHTPPPEFTTFFAFHLLLFSLLRSPTDTDGLGPIFCPDVSGRCPCFLCGAVITIVLFFAPSPSGTSECKRVRLFHEDTSRWLTSFFPRLLFFFFRIRTPPSSLFFSEKVLFRRPKVLLRYFVPS